MPVKRQEIRRTPADLDPFRPGPTTRLEGRPVSKEPEAGSPIGEGDAVLAVTLDELNPCCVPWPLSCRPGSSIPGRQGRASRQRGAADGQGVNRRVDPFVLTSHEVMRGIRVKQNVLVLRPIGWVQAACWIELLLASVVAAALVTAGGAWWVVVPLALVVAVNAGLRGRVAVFATAESVTIRNRWSTRVLPLHEVRGVSVVVTHWPVRQPAYLLTSPSTTGREWDVGIICTRAGARLACDALVSGPSAEAPGADDSPAAMKVDALHRWIVTHGATGT